MFTNARFLELPTLPSLLATAVFALASAGCATAGGPDSPFDGELQFIDVEVRNLNWSDATLWAHRGGMRSRLGIAPGKQDKSFRMDWRNSNVLYIEIDLFGGGRCVTPELSVDPGDIIELEIPIDMRAGANCLRR